MTTIICYILFLVLNGMAFYLLNKQETLVRLPYEKDRYMRCAGPECVVLFIFWTGLLGIQPLLAIRLALLEVFCIVGIFKAQGKVIWSWPMMLYIVFLFWTVIGLTYTPSPMFGIRMILKYIYPLFVVLLASAVVRDKEVFLKTVLGARITAVLSFVLLTLPGIAFVAHPIFWNKAALATNYITMCMISLALVYYIPGKRTSNIIWAIIFALPAFIWVFRTDIFGLGVGLSAFFFVKYRLKALPIIAAIGILGICSIFYIPAVKAKMYFRPNEVTFVDFITNNVDETNLNTSGRNEMWDKVMPFYEDSKMIGSGTGRVQKFFYTEIIGFGRGGQLHNDFLVMMCDNGLIGLILYLMSYFAVLFHCVKLYNKSLDPSVRLCSLVAGASLFGVLVTMYSDNTLSYSMATLSYPWGFYGMALGLNQASKVV